MSYKKYSFYSAFLFLLLMLFIYYNPVKGNLIIWTGSRASFPYITIILVGLSFICSLIYWNYVLKNKDYNALNLVLSSLILLYSVWWVIKLISL